MALSQEKNRGTRKVASAVALARIVNSPITYSTLPPLAIKYCEMILASTLCGTAAGAKIGSAGIVREVAKELGGKAEATVSFDGALTNSRPMEAAMATASPPVSLRKCCPSFLAMKPVILLVIVSTTLAAQQTGPIPFGSALDADRQIAESQQLAKETTAPLQRAKGDQHRTYHFAAAKTEMPYRLYVPTTWDGQSKLPLIVMLHGAGADENRYLDMNDHQMLRLAEQHGYVLASPLGLSPLGAYGTPLRLPAVFGQPEIAAKQRAQVTPEAEHTLELSEKDVINVLEIVLNEYPINRSSIFLAGHSMGAGGTWYLGAKYSKYWHAIAPMSGPFVDQGNYPWDRIRSMPVMMSEGTMALPSVQGSRLMRDWMFQQDFLFEYYEVKADHPGMVPLVLPAVFDFFDRYREK